MEIYLIRHGECYNSSAEYYDEKNGKMDPPLTENGRLQASALGERLRGIHFDMILSSDLIRASETAKIAFEGQRIIENPSLREIYLGDMYFHERYEYPQLFEIMKRRDTDFTYPNGESGEDVFTRVQPVIQDLWKSDMERVAIVTHGGTIAITVCGILGIDQGKRFLLGYPVNNCSVTILKGNKKLCLHTFNG